MLSSEKIRLLTNPIFKDNPITVQVLGICSALAVTVKLEPAIVMALSVTFVTSMSNVVLSLLRNTIPKRIRIIVQLVIVSALVILVDQLLKAFMFNVSKQLSIFVGLIITNCIIMGRIEAFALTNNVKDSFLDGLGNGLGYGSILIIIAFIRELFGSGMLFNHRIIPQSFYDIGYMDNGLMIMPPMALIIAGLLIFVQRSYIQKMNKHKKGGN